MKTIKLLILLCVTALLFISCTEVHNNHHNDDTISLEQLITGYDLWYVDYHRTAGNANIPFLNKAFTISFLSGKMYANNNIVDVGKTGNGLGVVVGNYDTNRGLLETLHHAGNSYNFKVVQLSGNEIRIDDVRHDVSYFLIGYQRNEFDYDKLFYDNIEYFLQEFVAWEKTKTINGTPNPFDKETYLQFTAENRTTFYSSHDSFGTDIDNIKWDFVGSYKIYDVQGQNDLKVLTLNYDNGDTEEFDLSVINDGQIRLYHTNSKTTYHFSGKGFVQYLKSGKSKSVVRNSGRERTKIKREVKIRKY